MLSLYRPDLHFGKDTLFVRTTEVELAPRGCMQLQGLFSSHMQPIRQEKNIPVPAPGPGGKASSLQPLQNHLTLGSGSPMVIIIPSASVFEHSHLFNYARRNVL